MTKYDFFDVKEVSKSVEIPEDKKLQKKIEKKPMKTKTKRIIGDKTLNKKEIIERITTLIKNNEEVFTLDFLRGQKQIYDSLYEMRKET